MIAWPSSQGGAFATRGIFDVSVGGATYEGVACRRGTGVKGTSIGVRAA